MRELTVDMFSTVDGLLARRVGDRGAVTVSTFRRRPQMQPMY
jgi:hypothetical protein